MIWSQVHAPKRACMCYGSAYSAVAAQIAALRVFILGLLRRCLRHAPRACGCSLSKLGSQKPNMSSKVQSENPNTLKVASAVVLQALTPRRSISGHAQCYAPPAPAPHTNSASLNTLNRLNFSGASSPSRKHRARLGATIAVVDRQHGYACRAGECDLDRGRRKFYTLGSPRIDCNFHERGSHRG